MKIEKVHETKVLLIFFISHIINLELTSCANVSEKSDLDLVKPKHKGHLAISIEKDWLVPREIELVARIVEHLPSEKCKNDTRILIEAVKKRQSWALQLVDSFPKSPTGLLYGNFYQLGNFDECVQSVQNIPYNNSQPIKGQYCLSDIEIVNYKNDDNNQKVIKRKKSRFEYNSTIHWAICIPSSCTTQDAKIFVEKIFEEMRDIDVDVTIDPYKCYKQEDGKPYSKIELIYGTAIGAYVIFVIVASIFHYNLLQKQKGSEDEIKTESFLSEIITCFSLIQNLKKFVYLGNSTNNFGCISALRVISMFCIIVGHCLIFLVGGPQLNRSFAEKEITRLHNTVFVNSTILVDNFLLISGFLMTFLLLDEFEKRKGRVNFFIIYIARYIRLTPAYLVMIGFYCTFFYRIGDGPMWKSKILVEQERCLDSWWLNLLYINNYVSTDRLCMFQSWFLDVDYHLFIIAPFMVYALWKNEIFGIVLIVFSFLISIAIASYYTLHDNLDPTFLTFAPEIEDVSSNEYFRNVYIKTHMKAGSYFIGLLFGYIVFKIQKSSVKLSGSLVWLGSILSVIFGLLSLFSIVLFYDTNHNITVIENVVYATLHRVCWTFSIGWLIMMCVTRKAEKLNYFFSAKFFQIASRLTYCAYLVNGALLLYHIGVLRQPSYMSYSELVKICSSILFLSTLYAFVLYILVESPIIGLEKILLKKGNHIHHIFSDIKRECFQKRKTQHEEKNEVQFITEFKIEDFEEEMS